MRILYLQHVPFEGPGYITVWAENAGCQLSSTKLYEGETFPCTDRFDWLIIMGGPMSVHDTGIYPWLSSEREFIGTAIAEGKRVLGICLGAQLIANVLGAKVYPCRYKEIGWFPIEKSKSSTAKIIDIFPDRIDVFHWHGETFDLPEGATLIASSTACANQGFVFRERVIGFQFHLESTPDSVRKLISHSSDEIKAAPYIQTAEKILADEGRFQKINAIMNRVLDYQLHST